jgi:hypothetical protein
MLIERIQSGELIDLEILRRGGNDESDQHTISLYRRFLLNKYPQMTFKNYQILSHNLENLKKPKGIIGYNTQR